MRSRRHFLEPLMLMQPGAASHVLVNARTGSILARDLELAADSRARTRGLLGRSGLAAGAVMILAPCNGIHTFFMRFTIDVVFVDREGRVLRVFYRLKPWRLGFSLKAFAALEFAAGSLERSGVAGGDRLTIVPK